MSHIQLAFVFIFQWIAQLSSVVPTTPEFDWSIALSELNSNRSIWNNYQITHYEYRNRKSCFCTPCYIADKYITVTDTNTVTNVAFVTEPNCIVQTPINTSYLTMNELFDIATLHLTEGLNANCSDMYGYRCGGSLSATYDSTYHYLTSLSLIFSPLIADAGSSYAIGCLSVFQSATTASNYGNKCRYDWQSVLSTLLNNKQMFESLSIKDYTYTAMRGSCMCVSCAMVSRIIEVSDEKVSSVSFDTNSFNCDSSSLYAPIDTNYTLISWFNHGIDYCTTMIDKGCTATFSSSTKCNADASLDVTFDAEKNFITSMIADKAAMAHDGGYSYTFTCINCNSVISMSPTHAPTPPCICTLQYDPYCCDNNQYSNLCSAQCAGYGTDKCVQGTCTTASPTYAPISCICTLQYDPYCCNNNQYSNLCFAQCAGYGSDKCSHNVCSSMSPTPTSTKYIHPFSNGLSLMVQWRILFSMYFYYIIFV